MFALEARPLVPSFPFVLFDHPTGMGSLWGAQKSTYRMSFCALSESVIPSLVARLSAPVRPAPQMGVRDLLLSLCPLGARGPEIAKPNPSRMCTYEKRGVGVSDYCYVAPSLVTLTHKVAGRSSTPAGARCSPCLSSRGRHRPNHLFIAERRRPGDLRLPSLGMTTKGCRAEARPLHEATATQARTTAEGRRRGFRG